jgi:hypothetical protein
MKKVLLIITVCVSTLTYGQSNEAGTIHTNVGFGLGLDIGSVSSDAGSSIDLLGGQFNYGLKAEYGIAEFVSAGIFLKGIKSRTIMTNEGEDVVIDEDPSLGLSGLAFGISGSFYAVNNDGFNLYFSPSFGYAPLSANLYDDDNVKTTEESISAGGMVYGLNAGVNLYFGGVAGMFFDLGYTKHSLTMDNDSSPLTQDISLNNFGITLGVALKFGK